MTTDKQQAALSCRDAFEREFANFDLDRLEKGEYSGEYKESATKLIYKGFEAAWNYRTPSPEAETYEDGIRKGLEMAAEIADAKTRSNIMAMNRAKEAGRVNVSSHRQSDAETCADIYNQIRALIKKETK